MNRAAFAPRSLAMNSIAGGTTLTIPVTAAEKAAGLPQWTVELWLNANTAPGADLPLLTRTVENTIAAVIMVNGEPVTTANTVTRNGLTLGLNTFGKAYLTFEILPVMLLPD